MVTLDDVAALAGVSRMTASNALRRKAIVRPETARRVLDAAERLGYRPNVAAQQLSSGRTHVISVSLSDFDLIFPAKFAAELSDQAGRRGYQIVAQQTRFSSDYEQAMLSSASMQICDGAIVCWPRNAAADFVGFSRRHPLVMLDAFELEGRIDGVFTPCIDGAAEGVRHLAGHGARRIAVIGSSADLLADDVPPNSSKLRLLGAARALRELGMADDDLHDVVLPCNWNREAGYAAMCGLLAERGWQDGCDALATLGFDAVCCVCDPIAIGVLKALTDAGVRVPQDVMVMGFDAVADGRFMTPGLSSVRIDPAEMARDCLGLLLERVDGTAPDEPRTVTVSHAVVARGSGERA
ncbi:LacI family DNA-binding transcriptional regulator [Bifidobacterium sp. 82T10]|uniref:LacI family DNA-binding transcriptional regulator n=2 Tax=Bifidobacterium miconis TaxID=2834435 RepID=A0ABS6WHI9_9BIFI|nr:LacI family DNA-binding transcriptional regulator [Bifidobacterium miconis]MBW3092765.1 LacI family DNA-binding transcriptional regulator [Bifidobacterium miconis]